MTAFNVCFIFSEMESNVKTEMIQEALGFTGEMRKLENITQESAWWPRETVCDFWAALREYLKFGILFNNILGMVYVCICF